MRSGRGSFPLIHHYLRFTPFSHFSQLHHLYHFSTTPKYWPRNYRSSIPPIAARINLLEWRFFVPSFTHSHKPQLKLCRHLLIFASTQLKLLRHSLILRMPSWSFNSFCSVQVRFDLLSLSCFSFTLHTSCLSYCLAMFHCNASVAARFWVVLVLEDNCWLSLITILV